MEFVRVQRIVNNMEIVCKLINSVAKQYGCRFQYNPQNGGLNPIVAKVGGRRPDYGGKGADVVCYFKPLPTQDLASSGFPRCFQGKKDGIKSARSLSSP